MYTLTYLAPIRAGRRAGTHELITVCSPSLHMISDVALCLNRRHVRNVRLWKAGRLIPM